MNVLNGQTAVITGASSGIGRAIACALADEGVQLCLLGRNVDAMRELNGAHVHKLDLADESRMRDCVSAIARELPQIDILIHSAGISQMGKLECAKIEDLDRQYRINVRAPFLLTQLLLPSLKPRKGQIAFINSTVAHSARAGVSQYAATKSALRAVADSLRDEVAPLGMRVISMFPGRTDTPMQRGVHAWENRPYKTDRLLRPQEVAEMLVSALRMPRSAEVKDLTILPSRTIAGECRA